MWLKSYRHLWDVWFHRLDDYLKTLQGKELRNMTEKERFATTLSGSKK